MDLLQSFFKIKLKILSQLSKKDVDKFCSPQFCAMLSSHKNVSNKLCLIMKILTEKNLNIIHFLLRQQPYFVWTITQDLIKLGAYNMSYSSLFKVSTNTHDETGCQCGRKQLRPGKIQVFFSKYLHN